MRKVSETFAAIVLSILFTVGLIYATLEIPRAISRVLLNAFPDAPDGQMVTSLRPFGYVSFAVTWILILAGFVTKRLKLSTLGSISSFLPTFGYFALTMFFLAGIGVLRLLWFPLLDLSPHILKLGHVVYVPYLLLELLAAPVPWAAYSLPTYASVPLSFIIMRLGLVVFSLGTMTWLYGKFKGFEITDFWIYRYSRHPQYLGFLLWSYGLLLLATFEYPPGGRYFPPPSLPWLISALIIIGVALHEENMMVQRHGENYVRYRNNTPFIVPLPKRLSALIVAPAVALLRKNRPENGKEVALMIIVYGTILVLLSTPLILSFPM